MSLEIPEKNCRDYGALRVAKRRSLVDLIKLRMYTSHRRGMNIDCPYLSAAGCRSPEVFFLIRRRFFGFILSCLSVIFLCNGATETNGAFCQ